MNTYTLLRTVTVAAILTSAAYLPRSLRAADEAPSGVNIVKPEINIKDGVVTLSTSTPDSMIFYTLDNSNPTGNSSPYLAPIDLPYGGVVKARALSRDRKQKSELSEAKIDTTKPGEKAPPSSIVPVTQCREFPHYDWVMRHAAVLAAVKQHNPQLLFIGDSITHFFGCEPSDVGGTGKNVWAKYYEPRNPVNLGYGWDRTENVLWRLTVGHELDNCAPKAAVVMIGTNNLGLNTPPEIALGVQKICEAIHARLPNTKILLLGVFPRDKKPGGNRQKIAEINGIISKLDGQNNITYLDFGAKFIGDDGTISPDIMPDALHPSEKGYQIWADAMGPTLKKLMEN
jgi:lysophospholipase L1-like esterase